MRIALVYRTGGDYVPAHVQRLVEQLRGVGNLRQDILLFTDANVSISGVTEAVPLHKPREGWWAKMNLYAEGIEGDLLYLDLDTSVLGDMNDIANVGQLAILRAKLRKDRGRPFYPGYQSALMYLTEEARRAVRLEWATQGGWRCIGKYPGGDDRFLETVGYWRAKARFFQDLVPGQIQHYKNDIRKVHGGKVPAGTRMVVFCKHPRPWEIEELRAP